MAPENTEQPAAPAAPAAQPATPTEQAQPAAQAQPATPPAPKVTLPKKNGVTRPKAGTKTGKVWEEADRISAELKGPAPRKAVMEACNKLGINQATIATQYGKWRKFYGLAKEPRAPKAPEAQAQASAPAAPPAAQAQPDTSVQG